MREKVLINVVTLENGIDYDVILTIEDGNKNYIVLSNVSDHNDLAIRRIWEKDDKEYLEKLDSEEEFEKIINLFYERIGKEDNKWKIKV